jgi:hypothetical protein
MMTKICIGQKVIGTLALEKENFDQAMLHMIRLHCHYLGEASKEDDVHPSFLDMTAVERGSKRSY